MSFFAKALSCVGLLLLALVVLPAGAQTASILGPITTQIAAGDFHNCALTTAGAVQCWGYNANGQLGNNSTMESSVPVIVSGLASGVAAITAGGSHTCALTTAGAVQCWGYNGNGQLGNNSTSDSAVPVPVVDASNTPISGVAAIAAGYAHTCALTTAGAVQCWGFNSNGELGNNSTTDSLMPVAVSGLASGVVAIAAGATQTCALTTAGAVLCWGSNSNGQLGNNSTPDSSVPVAVSGLASGVAAITAGGSHTCALTTAGAVQCWGSNSNGQLGNNSITDSAVPVQVSNLTSGVVAIVAGESHTCALTTTGAMQCWGANGNGQLGNNSTTDSHVPVAVSGLGSGVAAIAAGYADTCALTTTGAVQCWGNNTNGQLGDNTTTDSHVPLPVIDLASGVATIAAGANHTCALTTVGGVQCWGSNSSGQLGNNSTTDSDVPGAVVDDSNTPISGVAAIVAGGDHTCALTTLGTVQCWGSNSSGQLGNNSTADSGVPVPVVDINNTPISGVAAIAAGNAHTCALTTTGTVQCWGSNSNGQLGNNSTSTMDSTVPVPVGDSNNTPINGVKAITAGAYYTCALTTAGAVLCWGSNGNGQLGNNSIADSYVPVAVSGLGSGVAAIVAGNYHTCALTSGAVQCWGFNKYGQLGNNSTLDSHVPVTVSGLASSVVAIAAGYAHTCALASGAVQCWGDNNNGQLGNNSTTESNVPIAVNNLGSGAAAIVAGNYHTCALTTAGATQCWGSNSNGQLGDGSTTEQLTPVPISVGQSIAFNPPMSMGETGTIVDLSAVASSGNTVTFDTWTPDACSISGNILTIAVAPAALCGVRASQAGGTRAAGGSDAPAPQQLRLIRINSDYIFANGFEN